LIQTDIAVEDLLDVAATMLSVWKGDDERQKKRIRLGLKQLVQCLQQINDNLQESFRLSNNKTFAVGYMMSKIRAETNLKLKREAILNPTLKAGVSNAEYRLNQLTSNKRPTPPSKSKQPCKQRKCNYPVKTNKLEMFHSTTTKPKDGKLYMLVNECSFLFGQPINLVHKYLTDKSVIGFGRTTLQKAVKKYKEKGIPPQENSDGMKVGRPPLLEKENIQQLNDRLHNNVGWLAVRPH
jgi:hypothetical protein